VGKKNNQTKQGVKAISSASQLGKKGLRKNLPKFRKLGNGKGKRSNGGGVKNHFQSKKTHKKKKKTTIGKEKGRKQKKKKK